MTINLKLLLAALFLLILVPMVAKAQPSQANLYCQSSTPPYFQPCSATNPLASESVAYVFTPLGCFQITSLSTAQNLPTVPAGATLISLTVENQSVRMRDDGTSPTASVGELLPPGGPWPYTGSLSAIKFIQVANGAVIDYCSYK